MLAILHKFLFGWPKSTLAACVNVLDNSWKASERQALKKTQTAMAPKTSGWGTDFRVMMHSNSRIVWLT
jgi:hypothetical protein